jgi:hypothetical protein
MIVKFEDAIRNKLLPNNSNYGKHEKPNFVITKKKLEKTPWELGYEKRIRRLQKEP